MIDQALLNQVSELREMVEALEAKLESTTNRIDAELARKQGWSPGLPPVVPAPIQWPTDNVDLNNPPQWMREMANAVPDDVVRGIVADGSRHR